MNANELADELENKPLAYGNDIQEWLGEAATMLRILDGQLAFRIDAVTKYQAKVEEQQAEIERLQRLCESYIRSDYEGTSMFKPFMEELYGKAQWK